MNPRRIQNKEWTTEKERQRERTDDDSVSTLAFLVCTNVIFSFQTGYLEVNRYQFYVL